MHVHPAQEERFEVIEVTMRFRKGRKTVIAKSGDIVVVPAGTAHKFANAGERTARARVEVRPALRMENLLETTVALAEDGRTNRKGMPTPLDLALFVREFEREVQGAFPPLWVQRLSLAPVGWLARKLGHGARYAPRPAVA